MQVQSLCWEHPLEGNMVTHSVFLPGESHGQKSLWATIQRIAKSWTQLSD